MKSGDLVRINCKRHNSYGKLGLILEWKKGDILRNDYIVLIEGQVERINSGWVGRAGREKNTP